MRKNKKCMKNNTKNISCSIKFSYLLGPSNRFDPEADCEFHVLFNCTCFSINHDAMVLMY